jgi:uncharacterized protein (TIGR03663 family)
MKLFDWASDPKAPKLYWLLIFIVALGALAVRAPRLRMRPMHTDEAVHADKFGILLETGTYHYDSREYHGPTLNYFTLVPAWLRSQTSYAKVTEATLRCVPVAAGVLLILLTGFLGRGLGPTCVPAALLAAISPAFVFYSRYYIQEMLLVCFTFGAVVSGYHYAQSARKRWAVAAGVFVGLMHATKETCIIALAAMVLALLFIIAGRLWKGWPLRSAIGIAKGRHLVWGLVAAIAVSAAFYSGFFRHWQGVPESYLTYATYFSRAGGQGAMHVHPWFYYLRMLSFSRIGNGPVWTEGIILLLAAVGFVVALRGGRVPGVDGNLLRFVAVYTIAMTVIYSAIPYKTPWCLLSFLHGMILLAGVGVVALAAWTIRPVPRMVVLALLAIAATHLTVQAYRGSFLYYCDSRNPYVYAHPTAEVLTAVQDVETFARASGQGYEMPIQVICTGNDYWPLPWYFRAFTRVGWYSALPERIGPVVLVSSDLETALADALYVRTPPEERCMYVSLFDDPYYIRFRPGVNLLGFVRKDLWDQYRRSR